MAQFDGLVLGYNERCTHHDSRFFSSSSPSLPLPDFSSPFFSPQFPILASELFPPIPHHPTNSTHPHNQLPATPLTHITRCQQLRASELFLLNMLGDLDDLIPAMKRSLLKDSGQVTLKFLFLIILHIFPFRLHLANIFILIASHHLTINCSPLTLQCPACERHCDL